MLTEWQLANFKAIADKTTLQLAPLTILVGENSSGKSSILQSILLLAQTLRATGSRQPLVLNGEYIRLGYVEDVVHDGHDRLPIEIGFVLQNGDDNSKKTEVAFGVHAHAPDSDSREGVLSYLRLQSKHDTLFLERTFPKGNTLVHEEEFENLRITTNILNDIRAGMYDYTVKKIVLSRGKLPSKIDIYDLHASLYHFLPNKFLESYNALKYSMVQALKIAGEFLRSKNPPLSSLNELITTPTININNFKEPNGAVLRREILQSLDINIRDYKNYSVNYQKEDLNYFRDAANMLKDDITLSDWLTNVKRKTAVSTCKKIGDKLLYTATSLEKEVEEDNGTFISGIGVRSVELPSSLQEIQSEIINYFTRSVYYLGPLREDPRYIYSLPPYPELTHVGLKGEFTASVLERFKDDVIKYPLPPESGKTDMQIGEDKLAVALEKWLIYMGLLQSANTEDKGKMGTELTVRSFGVKRSLDLTSIGVGVSQILPTLVTGLIAPAGTTFLLEQPELHLHPKVQSMVADFLLGLTKVGKQCIVETHSEYLVNRLRRRIAEDESNKLAEQTAIYFVERPNGKSSFRKLDLNQYGSLVSWPDGFFDEGPNESELIMKAALKKRQQKKLDKNNNE